VNVKRRFWLCKRGDVFYVKDALTKKLTSLQTNDAAEAERLVAARVEAVLQPSLNPEHCADLFGCCRSQHRSTNLADCDGRLYGTKRSSIDKSTAGTRGAFESFRRDSAQETYRNQGR